MTGNFYIVDMDLRCQGAPNHYPTLTVFFFREGQSSNVFSFSVIPLETIVQVFLKVASGDHGNKKEQEETDSWIRYSISGTI